MPPINPDLQANKEITVQTREGRDISNSQECEIGNLELNSYGALRKKYEGPSVIFRTGLIPIYNCHGMTFASRRTTITEANEVQKILKDDKYERLQDKDVEPGDVVLYLSDDGDIHHSGIVVSKPLSLNIPLVLSKWGKGWEVIHPANQCGEYMKWASRILYYRITK